MRAVIVGGDSVEHTRRTLIARGFDKIDHWPGRKSSYLRRPLPHGVDLYVIVLDYISHNLARRIKQAARQQAQTVEFIGRKSGPSHPAVLEPEVAS
jgi:hypothetical protein